MAKSEKKNFNRIFGQGAQRTSSGYCNRTVVW